MNEYGFDAKITATIRNKARQIVGKAGLTWDDVPDIEQELATALHLALSAYEPQRSTLGTFASRVINKSVCKLLRHRRREKRGLFEAGAKPEGQTCLTPSHWVPSHADAINRRMDVAQAITRLPRDLRAVARSLGSKSVTDTARSLGMPRSTIYDAIERIRMSFKGAGLEVYL